ncbi:helix-turn-helix domain-containing protein, partial [Cellulosimicrobium sp. 22601]|uniref:helix-turn-helix domain-containing protein n=1 Tax=unclassified Cellulosimicrobium TaxID=2624466 RepID=UPI003F8787AA
MSTSPVEGSDLETPRAAVAAEVRAEMARVRLSGRTLGRMTGKSQAYWSRRISGDVALDVDDLATLSRVLGVPMWQLIAAGDDEGPHQGGPGGGLRVVRPKGFEPPTF